LEESRGRLRVAGGRNNSSSESEISIVSARTFDEPEPREG